MRDASRALLVALNFVILDAPGRFGPTPFVLGCCTLLLVLVNAAPLVAQAFRPASPQSSSPEGLRSVLQNTPEGLRHHVVTAFATAAAAALVFTAGRMWLHQLLVIPIDSQRADMLVVIQAGIRNLLLGHNPYAIYKVPWDATLPYGPVMWVPYIALYLFNVDIRFVSLAGELFVAVVCAFAAAGFALDGRYGLAAAWLLVLCAVAFNATLFGFTPIAHTPSYWPLLAALAWLVGRERWYAAAAIAGLLVVARTTMVAVVPILLIAIWFRGRTKLPAAAALLLAAATLPYLPFAIADPKALAYALYGSYESLMKGFVWTSTPWVQQTIGITGILLRQGWNRLVEPAQVMSMLLVYALAWRALARGASPAPWMTVALLVFSMTTLWPVHYIYFDVFLLALFGALGDARLKPRAPWPSNTEREASAERLRSSRMEREASAERLRPSSMEREASAERLRPSSMEREALAERLGGLWLTAAAASCLIVTALALRDIPRDPTVDVGSRADRPLLYSGFADDEAGDRSFAWVDGSRATVLLPRRTRRDAEIVLDCQPNLPTPGAGQEMSASLNGVVLGTVPLREGWQSVILPAPERAWKIGVNELALSFSLAISPRDAGISADARKLSVAFDQLTVRAK